MVEVRVRGMHAGASGNVLINENAYRISSYNVWDYADGHDSYYRSMLVDLTLTQSHDEVSAFQYFFSDELSRNALATKTS